MNYINNSSEKGKLSKQVNKLVYPFKQVHHYYSQFTVAALQKIFGRSFNFWEEKEKEIFEKSGEYIDKCPSIVAKTSYWMAEIIIQEIDKK